MSKELKLGLNPRHYELRKSLFVKNMMRLGPNLWLARYTEDKKGQSKIQHLALLSYQPRGNPTRTWLQDGFTMRGGYVNMVNNSFSFFVTNKLHISDAWIENAQVGLTTMMLLARTFFDPRDFFADRVFIYQEIFNEPTS